MFEGDNQLIKLLRYFFEDTYVGFSCVCILCVLAVTCYCVAMCCGLVVTRDFHWFIYEGDYE